jgi:fumarate reductase flavoprotein subunit
MRELEVDIAVVGGGGAGLRAAIAAAEADPGLRILLISKVYPMRSHTVAAEGGAAAVIQQHDSMDAHFEDTVKGGDWLAEQGVVERFVREAYRELVQLEHWGCPWSRHDNGEVRVRRFGGMRTERTWFAADKTGFHILHTLFQTSLRYPSIERLDEYFVMDLIIEEGQVHGLLALELASGALLPIRARAVILATGGAGRLYRVNTNGSIVTGDGMALAFRHGVPLRDMEFVQYHPTGLPGSGILISEAARGEGGVLLNKDGHRYLQDYGLGPETPVGKPQNKVMELGPRDKLSQAFWHEQKNGRTVAHPQGDAVHLDVRHLGEEVLLDRLPFIYELARSYVNVDPLREPIPVRPAVHYTMGGVLTDANGETPIRGLYAAGECASNGLHGANRLGSNSLSELLVFGRIAGEHAAERARTLQPAAGGVTTHGTEAAAQSIARLLDHHDGDGTGNAGFAELRRVLTETMEMHCGIYREHEGLSEALVTLADLKRRYTRLKVRDRGRVFNTELLHALELGFSLDVAEAMCQAALERRESRGSHQRLDPGCTERDDARFLKHSLAYFRAAEAPRIEWQEVDVHRLPPGVRTYGEAGSRDASRGTPA